MYIYHTSWGRCLWAIYAKIRLYKSYWLLNYQIWKLTKKIQYETCIIHCCRVKVLSKKNFSSDKKDYEASEKEVANTFTKIALEALFFIKISHCRLVKDIKKMLEWQCYEKDR